MSTLTEAIVHQLRPRRDVGILLWNDRWLSAGELEARSSAFAGGLIDLGVRPGDRVVLGLANSADLVTAVLAVLRSGALLVPLNPAGPPEEAAHVVSDSLARMAITGPEQAGALREARTGAIVLTSLDEVKPADRELPHRSAEDPALIIYTSGTTGRPKGAVLPHRALLSNFSTVARAWKWTAADRLLLTLPCFHLHGLGLGILGSLLVGSQIVLRPRFTAEEVPTLLAEHRCTVFFGVPTMYNRLVALPPAATQVDLSAMRLWVSGSAPLTAATHDRFRERFGYALMDRYGMTEACFVLSTPYDEPRRPGVVGRPLPGIDVRLANPEALDRGDIEPTPDGEEGELVFRGPNLFLGYWQRPHATRECFVGDFFRSGDLAVREPDGQYRIVGRRSIDIIKSRGFKIGAVEIENCLQQHPAVAEAAVVGVPDPDRGEAVVAVVTAASGASVDAEALRAHCRAHLAPHKVPARFVFVREIPRTGPGKFKKSEIVTRLGKGSLD